MLDPLPEDTVQAALAMVRIQQVPVAPDGEKSMP